MYKSIAIFIVGLTLVVSGCQSGEVGRPLPVTGETVATVNGVEIRNTDLNTFSMLVQNQTGRQIPAEDLLNKLVDEELMRQAAVEAGVHQDPKLIEELNSVSANINRHFTNMVIAAYVEKLQASDTSTEALQKTYDDYVAALPTKEYKAKHILSATKEEAVANIKALKAGKNFAKLAKEKSKDEGSSVKGGDLGWVAPNQSQFTTAMQALEPGKFSQEPVQTEYGWHVILVEDIRENKLPGMDEIRSQLQRMANSKMLEKHIEELRKAAAINIKGASQTKPAASEAPAPDAAAPSS
jgi:peptidyl-prolyl cis-trans isomerase C